MNAAPILHAFDYGVYAPRAVRRSTAPHGVVRRRTARSVNAPLVTEAPAYEHVAQSRYLPPGIELATSQSRVIRHQAALWVVVVGVNFIEH